MADDKYEDIPLTESKHVNVVMSGVLNKKSPLPLLKDIAKVGIYFKYTNQYTKTLPLYKGELFVKQERNIEMVSFAIRKKSDSTPILVEVKPDDSNISVRNIESCEDDVAKSKIYWISDNEADIKILYDNLNIIMDVRNAGYSYTKEILLSIPILGKILCKKLEPGYWGWSSAELVSTLLATRYNNEILYTNIELYNYFCTLPKP